MHVTILILDATVVLLNTPKEQLYIYIYTAACHRLDC